MAVGRWPAASSVSPNARTARPTLGLSALASRAASSAPRQIARLAQRRNQREPRQQSRRVPASIRERRNLRGLAGRPLAISVVARIPADRRQPASVHLPLLSTTTSRSFSLERNDTTLPSTHISVTMVSPGKTGEEKRTSKLVMRLGSYFASVEITARHAVPYEHRPCRIGRGKPAILATFGIAVQRIAVARQRIDEGLVGARVAGVHEIRRARRQLMRFRRAVLRSAEAAVAARERRADQSRELVAGRLSL